MAYLFRWIVGPYNFLWNDFSFKKYSTTHVDVAGKKYSWLAASETNSHLCRDQDSNLGFLGHNEGYWPLYDHGHWVSYVEYFSPSIFLA